MLDDVHKSAVNLLQKEPMSRADNLLSHLAQECAEVAIRCTKAQMFGLLEVQPEQSLTNAERIAEELCDLYATVDELRRAGLLPLMYESDRQARISAKQRKAGTFREYSCELGRLVSTTEDAEVQLASHGIALTASCNDCRTAPQPAPDAEGASKVDLVVEECQRRMDAVVEAAVEWHQSGRVGDDTWFDKSEVLTSAIESLLELRSAPSSSVNPECFCGTELEAGTLPERP